MSPTAHDKGQAEGRKQTEYKYKEMNFFITNPLVRSTRPSQHLHRRLVSPAYARLWSDYQHSGSIRARYQGQGSAQIPE